MLLKLLTRLIIDMLVTKRIILEFHPAQLFLETSSLLLRVDNDLAQTLLRGERLFNCCLLALVHLYLHAQLGLTRAQLVRSGNQPSLHRRQLLNRLISCLLRFFKSLLSIFEVLLEVLEPRAEMLCQLQITKDSSSQIGRYCRLLESRRSLPSCDIAPSAL